MRSIIRAYFERGLTLSEIVARDDVFVKSRGSISKRAKAEGWIAGIKKQSVSDEIKAKQFLSDILKQKETMPPLERNIHDSLVSERLKAVMYFKGLNTLVAEITERKLNSDGEAASYQDLNAAATAITKAQENILGKQPDTVINNSNMAAVQNTLPPPAVYAEIAKDLLRRV